MTARPLLPANPWPGLGVLSAAIFVCTVSEFLPTGLLPGIAREFGVSNAQVGLLVSAFAGMVVLSSAPLTALTRRWSRRGVIVTVLVVFAAANLLAALAPSYEVLLAARVFAGAAHGLFWAVAAAYPVHLVEPARFAKAIAVTNVGGTLAFVLGVPLGTALGQAFGWRLAFGILSVMIAALAVAVLAVLPKVAPHVTTATGEIPLPARRDPTLAAVIALCLVTLMVMLGQHSLYTYIAPWLAQVAGIEGAGLPIVLLIYGVAGALGLVAASVLGRAFARQAFIGGVLLAAASVALLALAGSAGWPVYVLVATWGAVMGLLPSLIQAQLLRVASSRIRDVSSAFLTTAFNIGIGGGALLGAAMLSGLGIASLPWATAVLMVASLGVGAVAWRRRRRTAAEPR